MLEFLRGNDPGDGEERAVGFSRIPATREPG
jgi:hypothetical protein